MKDSNDTFKIGICMAGAISAGAYTAGVIDYLIEALEEWQKRKDSNQPDTPTHNVEIPVIGGASAGGMMGIITAAAIQDIIHPVKELNGNIMQTQPLNKFYHSWVDLVKDDMLDILLNTDDISKNNVESALNSDFIDEIAEKAINVTSSSNIERKYISKNLKVFVTLTNLKGMNLSVAFKSNSEMNKYIVTSHNDYACFKLCDSDNSYDNDGWIPLNFKSNFNIDIAKNAAMATGAFPVGLKARKIVRGVKYLNDLEWFRHITKEADNPFESDPYSTLNIDGGMINNEPFDKVREVLLDNPTPETLKNHQNYDYFDSTVLMIDPFPYEQDKFDESTKMSSIIGNTIEALIGQARLKTPVLIDAMDSEKAGQFLIAPVRYEMNNGIEKSIEGKKAIACGSLEGFGGFVSKEFRIHDYFLGRANCEKFLRDYFTVPIDTTNPIFTNGYASVTQKEKFFSKDKKLQIIPIFTEEQAKPYLPKFSNGKEFPSTTSNKINAYRCLLKRRVGKIILNISNYTKTERFLLWASAKLVLNGKIADAIIETVIGSLKEHKLINE